MLIHLNLLLAELVGLDCLDGKAKDFRGKDLGWYPPGGNPGAEHKSICSRCYLRVVAFE